ncbi:MAG TPA: DUF3857 domain-containing transglutaminase family protein [Pyrinomonadaceae bacterium]|jgi:hypothetical protein
MKQFARLFSFFFFLLAVINVAAATAAGDEVPAWFTQFRTMQTPAYEKDVKAVVLQKDSVVTVGSDGKAVTTMTYVVRILSREGRREAVAVEPYLVSSGKIREIKGWLIRADGTTKVYGKDQVLDRISDPDDIYNELRLKIIDASDEADAGAIFGYQVTSEEMPLFDQDSWLFQDNLPTLLSRYTLSLPNGWKAESNTFNYTKIQPSVSGSTYVWELRNLQPIAEEPESPSIQNLVPRLAVSYSPSATTTNFRTFKDWTEVSRWNTEISDPSVIIDDNIANKARELTASAKTEFEKIRAVGSFVQNLQYISIDIGVGRGNGYRPRPSTLVLQRGYGDCKDKANLMRALLKVLKIEAYPVAIYSGDPNFVREEWASPRQFNHCIIAVKVGNETNAPTVITHPTLGRLMIFDATDAYTPVGDLPDYLQGSFALIVAGNDGKLMKMPVTSPEANKMVRNVEMTIADNGDISGVIRERAQGQQAAYARRLLRAISVSDYNKMIEGWVVRGISTARVGKIAPVDKNSGENQFDLDVELKAPVYGQLMQNRLLVFKPVVVDRLNALRLTDSKRTHPVIMEANAFSETAVFTLPTGFIVDETPDAVNLETPFGKYSTSYEVKDNSLIFKRSLTLNSATIPVDKYASVKDFFVKIRSAEQSPVVLMRK